MKRKRIVKGYLCMSKIFGIGIIPDWDGKRSVSLFKEDILWNAINDLEDKKVKITVEIIK